eukprot:3667718-Amphidinium_carterae.1
MHMGSYSIPKLPPWALSVMYGSWLPPSLHLEKLTGRRNPLDVPVVDHKMLSAIVFYMRKPNNWTTETADSPEGYRDVRFRLGVEPISIAKFDTQIPPYMDSPHHYVSYYVAMYPNPDDGQVSQKIKSYCERRTPYSDYQVAGKRGICTEVHDDHVISYVEMRDLAMLQRNMNWCFSESSTPSATAFRWDFSKNFENTLTGALKFMMIEHQCDGEREHNTLTLLHRQMDLPLGPPDDLETPNETLSDW